MNRGKVLLKIKCKKKKVTHPNNSIKVQVHKHRLLEIAHTF